MQKHISSLGMGKIGDLGDQDVAAVGSLSITETISKQFNGKICSR